MEYIRNNKVDRVTLDMGWSRGLTARRISWRILKLRPESKAILASDFSEGKRVNKALKPGP